MTPLDRDHLLALSLTMAGRESRTSLLSRPNNAAGVAAARYAVVGSTDRRVFEDRDRTRPRE